MKSKLLGKVVIAATVIFILVLLVVRFYVVDYSVIPQNGMYPGKPTDSFVFGWMSPYRIPGDVKRGDFIFFTRTENQIAYKYGWRVIGLPGDKISVENDVVTINGSVLKSEFLRDDASMRIFLESNGVSSYEVAYPKNMSVGTPPSVSISVPENHFFVLGDNRYNARDSRFFGPIAFDSIVAKAFY